MMKMKAAISILLTVPMLSSVSFAQSNVKVYVNGMRVNENTILADDTTYVPLRAVSEAMGAVVEWDDASKSVYVSFSEDDAVAKIVENTSPSVVTIVGNYAEKGEIYKYNNPTMHGSGVIYKSNGYIITNAHVVKDIKNLTVVLNDGESVPGTVLYSDEEADIAVVKIDKLGLRPISMADKSTILSGKTAISMGTPISLSMRNTVTKGILSGCDVVVSDSYYKLLQTDAAINPGNSGGPLLNLKGELIGINSSKFVSVGIDNVGFAIPVDTVQYVLDQFEKYGYVLRPDLKFELEESWEAKIGLPTKKGLTVKKSSDEKVPVNAVISSVNGKNVHSVADWNEAVKQTYNGTTLEIIYTYNGIESVVSIQG